MRPIASFSDLPTLEAAFTEWYADNMEPAFTGHSEKVTKPIPRESIYWKPALFDATDAFTWASEIMPDLDDFETQAMGLTTMTCTVAEAKGKCHRIIRAHKAIKRLADSAERKSSAMQTLIKQGA